MACHFPPPEKAGGGALRDSIEDGLELGGDLRRQGLEKVQGRDGSSCIVRGVPLEELNPPWPRHNRILWHLWFLQKF